jgi:hypothetical protein
MILSFSLLRWNGCAATVNRHDEHRLRKRAVFAYSGGFGLGGCGVSGVGASVPELSIV